MKISYLNKFSNFVIAALFLILNLVFVQGIGDVNTSNDVLSINVDVVETREIFLYFTPINEIEQYDLIVARNSEFLKSIYPIGDESLNVSKDDRAIEFLNELEADVIGHLMINDLKQSILTKVFLEKKRFSSAIGIVPAGYLYPLSETFNWTGLKLGKVGEPNVILIDETQLKTLAHEVGHIFELCDEYSISRNLMTFYNELILNTSSTFTITSEIANETYLFAGTKGVPLVLNHFGGDLVVPWGDIKNLNNMLSNSQIINVSANHQTIPFDSNMKKQVKQALK